MFLEHINQLVIKTNAVEEIIEVCSCRISADKKYIKAPTKELFRQIDRQINRQIDRQIVGDKYICISNRQLRKAAVKSKTVEVEKMWKKGIRFAQLQSTWQ